MQYSWQMEVVDINLCACVYIYICIHFIWASQVALFGKEPACQCRRHKRQVFDPWVGKIPWRRAWQPTLVFLPRESHGQREPDDLQSMGSDTKESDTKLNPTGIYFVYS